MAKNKVNEFFQEFKKFAIKGNMIDMAVGVIIGGAFGKIITSLVNDIVMPLIGGLTGGFDCKSLVWHVAKEREVANPLYEAAKLAEQDLTNIAPTVTVPAVDVSYGMFIQNLVDFLLIALCIFIFLRAITKVKIALEKKEEAEAAAAPAEPAAPVKSDETVLLEEIRDLLKAEKK